MPCLRISRPTSSRVPPLRRPAQRTEAVVRAVTGGIMGLAIHDLPLIRQFLPSFADLEVLRAELAFALGLRHLGNRVWQGRPFAGRSSPTRGGRSGHSRSSATSCRCMSSSPLLMCREGRRSPRSIRAREAAHSGRSPSAATRRSGWHLPASHEVRTRRPRPSSSSTTFGSRSRSPTNHPVRSAAPGSPSHERASESPRMPRRARPAPSPGWQRHCPQLSSWSRTTRTSARQRRSRLG